MQDQTALTFEGILEENKDKIYRICRIYAVSPMEPQDLFQEVVFQVWKSFSSFEGKSNISTWVYKIALNVCHRSKMNLEKRNDNMFRLESIRFIPAENPPDKSQQEKYQALHDCIASLNESDQSIVILYLEDLSYKEIGAITGLSENHIAVKMKRIRSRLLECITPKLS
ncbi:MAG: sigma-70 family RNA polymerase sigma factor [Saprospiraceae bacterium]